MLTSEWKERRQSTSMRYSMLCGKLLSLLVLTCRFAGAVPLGLFVSSSSFGNGTTAYGRMATSALQLICAHFNASTSPNKVHSLAIDHLTDPSGAYLSDAVEALAPYFECFDAVYVGTADNHFASDLYCKALLNASFTHEYVKRSLAAAERFTLEHPAASMPNLRWYLNYEAAGNYFGTGCSHFTAAQEAPPPSPIVAASAFTAAYVDMFAALTNGLRALRDVSIMWSPTFNWQASFVPDRAALLGNLSAFFARLPLLTEVANQDAVGKYSLFNIRTRAFTYNMTCADTAFYQALLREAVRDAAADVRVSVNMELFSRRNTVPQSTITGDPFEHAARKCCYSQHNLTVGPSWQITDWYRANFIEWDPMP